jgi:hypothetical protein
MRLDIFGTCSVYVESRVFTFVDGTYQGERTPLTETACLLFFPHQALSPQMIILRVAMGRGFLKETVKDMNTTLVAVNEKPRGSPMTIYEIESSACRPGTPASSSGTSVN